MDVPDKCSVSMDVSQLGIPTTCMGAMLASCLCRENFANTIKYALVQHCLMDKMYCIVLQKLIFLHLRKHGSGSYCSPSPGAGLMIPLPQCLDPKQWDHIKDMFSIDVPIRISLSDTSILCGFLLLNLYSVVNDIISPFFMSNCLGLPMLKIIIYLQYLSII